MRLSRMWQEKRWFGNTAFRTPFPIPIPHVANSLDEVRLEGAINVSLEPGALDRLIGDALRALRPGGSLRIHGLAGVYVL